MIDKMKRLVELRYGYEKIHDLMLEGIEPALYKRARRKSERQRRDSSESNIKKRNGKHR
jgi:hypothetical protein